jgi:hypothetical protein
MNSTDFFWVECGRCVRLTTYHPYSAERQEIRGLNQLRTPVGVLGLSVGVTFTFITFLIISPNLISALLFCDALGLVSYLLL